MTKEELKEMRKNPVGKKFQMLTVLYLCDYTKNGKRFWHCKCDCGNETEIATGELGKIKSCGCLKNKSKMQDLTGQTFGHLKVLSYYGRDNSNKPVWTCLCDCGKEKNVRAADLKSGKVVSCGCWGKKARAEAMHERAINKKENPSFYKDLTGQKFNNLLVLCFDKEKTKEKNQQKIDNKRAYWKCRCDCGNITYVNTSDLLGGYVKSCGCLKSSGEQKIGELLTNNNIYFEKEKIFNNCILPSGFKARFDFYVNNSYLIEYDGEQHFLKKPSKNSYFTEERLASIKINDNFKNNWCKENNIPLIRIPYTHLEELKIQDLLLETSNFII